MKEEWRRQYTSKDWTQASTETGGGTICHQYGTSSRKRWRQTAEEGGRDSTSPSRTKSPTTSRRTSDLQKVTRVSESFCELNFISLVLIKCKTDCMINMYYKCLNTYQLTRDILVTSIKTRWGCIKSDPCHVNSRWSTFEPNWTQIWDPVLSESYKCYLRDIHLYIHHFLFMLHCIFYLHHGYPVALADSWSHSA